MPFDVTWYDDQHTIIHMLVHGHPTWDEYHIAIDQVIEKVESTPRRVDLVLDDRVGMPPGNPMPHLKVAIDKAVQHSNLGMSMTVSEKSIALFPALMMETAGRLYGVDMKRYGRFLKSMDEAVAIIMADRAKDQSTE